MSSISTKNYTILDVFKSYEKHSYTKEPTDYFKTVSHFTQSSSGTYRIFKFLSKIFKSSGLFFQYLGLNPVFASNAFMLQKKFNFLTRGMILTKMPSSIVGLKKSLENFEKEDLIKKIRVRDKSIKNVLESIADFSFLAQFGDLLGLYSLGELLGPFFKLSGEVFLSGFSGYNAKMAIEDFYKNKKFEQIALKSQNERLITISKEKNRLNMMNVAKSVATSAMAFFMAFEMIFKIVVIPEVGMLFFSTIVVILSIWTHFYKESMTYPEIE
ncbi:MAG: hypothetical protein JXA94_00095 [Parachlamydiales bacterium]|nr:hypothetical protein [Parachlamydiales bacterium]